MSCRCLNCNAVFDSPLTVPTETGPVSGCPYCGLDDMEPVEQCEDCEKYFAEGTLFGNICLDCLRERIDYPKGLAYLIAKDLLREFMQTIDVTNATEAPLQALLLAFLTRQTDEQYKAGKPFLTAIRKFILDDRIAADDFYKWLKEAKQI